MFPARFIRAIGFFVCLTGLSALLLLATSRFYTPSTANSVKASQESQVQNPPNQMSSPSEENSGTKPTQQQIYMRELPELDAPVFSIPHPDPSPIPETDSSDSTSKGRQISPASPTETGNAVIRLVIPDLKLDAQVRYIPFKGNTWDLNDLGQSIAWLGNMTDGETTKNLVLAGHITVRDGTHGPFRYLSRLTPGAKLTVYTVQYIYTYQVRELAIVKPEDTYLTRDTLNSQLTLLTCATWNEKTKSYLRRQIAIADLLKVEPNLQELAN